MKKNEPDNWNIVFYIEEKDHLSIFESALDPFVDGMSMEEDDNSRGRRVVGFCSVKPNASEIETRFLLGSLALGLKPPKFSIEGITSIDWVAQYQALTQPVTIGQFFIYPDHFREGFPKDKIPIALDAGLAFGTGEHQTTEGCLRALERLLTDDYVIKNALDVGCGTAILAIGMSKIVPEIEILACDNDLSAVSTASENIKKNRCAGSVTVCQSNFYSAPEIKSASPFDLVVANILAGPLVDAASETAQIVSPAGHLILSGILDKQAVDVVNAHMAEGFTVVDQLLIDEWATLVLKSN